jgi:predicted ATPase
MLMRRNFVAVLCAVYVLCATVLVACPTKIVFTGAPGTGKTTTIEYLRDKYGFDVVPETARFLIDRVIKDNDDRQKNNMPLLPLPYMDQMTFQPDIFELQLAWESKWYDTASNKVHGIVFLDRAIPDCVAYHKVRGVPLSPKLLNAAANVHHNAKNMYAKVFIFDFLPQYVNDPVRSEDLPAAMVIHRALQENYLLLGYELVIVPAMSIEERSEFVLNELKKSGLLPAQI